MTLTPLYDSTKGTMQVAGLMSGSGTNLVKIIEEELHLKKTGDFSFHVAVIFTDNMNSNARNIGLEYKIPVLVRDIRTFYKDRGRPLRDMELRQEYDADTVKVLSAFNISLAAYAGYMSIASKPLIDAFLGVNVHPADLSIKNPDRTRKYVGDHAVRDAILAGEKYICSTTHIIEEKVDGGRILMISVPLKVELPENFDKHNPEHIRAAEKSNQTRLKEQGDWKIFPKTLLDIAKGRFTKDEVGRLHYNEKMIPDGLQIYRLADQN